MNKYLLTVTAVTTAGVLSAFLAFNSVPDYKAPTETKKTVSDRDSHQHSQINRIAPDSEEGYRHYSEEKHSSLCNHKHPTNNFLKNLVKKKGNRVIEIVDLPESNFKQQLTKLQTTNKQAVTRALNHLMELDLPEADFEELRVDPTGEIIYACRSLLPENIDGEADELITPQTSLAPISSSSPPIYHSKLGSPNTIYLDFNGENVSGTAWNSNGEVWKCIPYDRDGDSTTFNDQEQTHIHNAWKKVAEDYAAFDVDVTTERPKTMDSRVAHVIITADLDQQGRALPHRGYGGIAYVNVFGGGTWATDYLISWSQPGGANLAEIISHEVGHNMGLSHDGNSTRAYYGGHGSGETSWVPIMGLSNSRQMSQWSKGDYYDANNLQDDLNILSRKLSYQSDDHGNSVETASRLAHANGLIDDRGLIERSGEADYFSFTAAAGSITLNVDSWKEGVLDSHHGNMDVKLELKDSLGNTVASHDPISDTDATLVYNAPAGGVYYVVVTPSFVTGYDLDPPVGYPQYACLGQYFISGSFSTSEGNAAPVIETAAIANPASLEVSESTNLSIVAVDPDRDPLTYSWSKVSGPGTVSFTSPDFAQTTASFSTFGTYSLRVTVSDGALVVTSSVSVTVTEPNLSPLIDTAARAMPASIEADDSTTLSVSASDPNGDPLTYNWSKVSGPGLVSFANAGSATTQASFSTQGTYSVRVTVSDGMASASSSTLITVNAPAPDDIISQSGSISLAQSSPDAWQRIDLDQSFTDPVVIFSPLTYNEGEQAHVRVRNVSANYFEWKIEEWDHQDGIHSQESVQYAVFEAGLYTLSDGRVFVAANTVADTRFQTTSFSNTFTEIPIVITQLGSGLSTRAGSAVIDNVTTSSFDVKVLEEKIKGKNHRQEIVSYIALEPGTYQMDGIQEGQIVVDSVDNSWYKLQFDISSPEKQLFFASFQTQNEKYLVDLRIRNLAADSVEVKADQGTISSSAKGGNGQGGGGSKTQEDSKKTFGYIILNL